MLLLPKSYPDRKHAERFNRAAEAAVGAPEVGQALGKAMPACPTLEHLALVVEVGKGLPGGCGVVAVGAGGGMGAWVGWCWWSEKEQV